MPTLLQLSRKNRIRKRRRCLVAALKGAPQRHGLVVRIGTTTPKKPNSAKRRYVKVRVMYSKKLVFAKVPGIGSPGIQEFSSVLLEGGSPPDVPGINYTLIRGALDFDKREEYGRKNRRSKFGLRKAFVYTKDTIIEGKTAYI